jgi:hypothetical protein
MYSADLYSLRLIEKPIVEDLGHLNYQTVPRLRNKVFRRLSPGAMALQKYQHTIDDLEIYFIVTALLHAAAVDKIL